MRFSTESDPDAVVTNVPSTIPPPPLLAPIFGGLFMVAVLAAVIWFVVTVTERTPYDTEPFCLGWEAGSVFGLQSAGMDSTLAGQVVASGAAAPCVPLAATRGFEPERSWCEGLAQAFLQVGADLGKGSPPEGAFAFVEGMTEACLSGDIEESPLLGGGGPAPVQN